MYSTHDMQKFERASNSASLASKPLQHQFELLWLVGGALKLLALATVQEALPSRHQASHASGALAASMMLSVHWPTVLRSLSSRSKLFHTAAWQSCSRASEHSAAGSRHDALARALDSGTGHMQSGKRARVRASCFHCCPARRVCNGAATYPTVGMGASACKSRLQQPLCTCAVAWVFRCRATTCVSDVQQLALLAAMTRQRPALRRRQRTGCSASLAAQESPISVWLMPCLCCIMSDSKGQGDCNASADYLA